MSELYLVEDLFNTLIALEEYGVETYTNLSEKTSDLEVNKLFKNLADQEKEHKEYYKELKEKFNTTDNIEEEYSAYLNILIKNSFFKTSPTDNINDIESALTLAVALEKETLLFLTETQTVLGESSYKIFEDIKNEERRHLALILDMIEKRKEN